MGRTLAVGVDLVDVGRVRAALSRFPARFVARVLSPEEQAYCLSRPDPAPHVAARFAAKEAVIKCLGGGCALNEIEVVRALSGSPSITLHGRAKARAQGKARSRFADPSRQPCFGFRDACGEARGAERGDGGA